MRHSRLIVRLLVLLMVVACSGTIPQPPPASTTTSAALSAPPAGQYLLVELLRDIQGTQPVMIDFPTYNIITSTQQLSGLVPKLNPTDIGFFARKSKMRPPGGGISADLKVIATLPYTMEQGISILSMHQDGSVTIDFNGTKMVVGTGQTQPLGKLPDSLGTADASITNYSYLPRDRIQGR